MGSNIVKNQRTKLIQRISKEVKSDNLAIVDIAILKKKIDFAPIIIS